MLSQFFRNTIFGALFINLMSLSCWADTHSPQLISGVYTVKGHEPDSGQPYSGLVMVEACGSACYRYVGFFDGAAYKGQMVVNASNSHAGGAYYRVAEGKLDPAGVATAELGAGELRIRWLNFDSDGVRPGDEHWTLVKDVADISQVLQAPSVTAP